MRHDHKNFLIIDSYAGNIGDIGILVSLFDQLSNAYPNSRIVVESSHPTLLRKIIKLKNSIVVPRIFDIEQIDRQRANIIKKMFHIIIGTYDIISVLITVVAKKIGVDLSFSLRRTKKYYIKLLSESDLVISTGGGFLNTNFQYFFRLYIYLLSHILNKKIIMVAQSIGPFHTKLSRLAIPYFLNKSVAISLREPFSHQYLKKFNLAVQQTKSADLAYLLKEDANGRTLLKNLIGKRVSAISLKEDRNKPKNDNFIKVISAMSNRLIEKKFHVILICHTYKDYLLAENILQNVKKPGYLNIIPFGVNPKTLKSLYGLCDFVIASRMHSIVFCSDLGTPFISISSDNKFLGLQRQLEYERRLLLNYNDLTFEKLNKSVNYLLHNRLKIEKHLKKVTPGIRKASGINLGLIKAQINN